MNWQEYAFEGGAIWLDLSEGEMMRQRLDTTYERAKVDYMYAHLKSGQTFVDVGAHCGYFALLAAKIVGPTGRVIAFEPFLDNAVQIMKAREANDYEQLRVFQYGLSEQMGWYDFYRGANSGHWSMRPISRKRARLFVIPLDQLPIDHIDMMKIDVEGHGRQVLDGAQRTLSHNPGLKILMDLHPQYDEMEQDIRDLVDPHGVELIL